MTTTNAKGAPTKEIENFDAVADQLDVIRKGMKELGVNTASFTSETAFYDVKVDINEEFAGIYTGDYVVKFINKEQQ